MSKTIEIQGTTKYPIKKVFNVTEFCRKPSKILDEANKHVIEIKTEKGGGGRKSVVAMPMELYEQLAYTFDFSKYKPAPAIEIK